MSATRLRRTNFAVLASLVGVLACGKDEGPSGGNPSISIAVSPTSITINQGASGQVTASITREGGFTGDVTITTEGAPAGVTGTVSNVSTTGSTTTGTITINVPEATAPGTYNLTARASGTGVTDATVAFSLTVAAKPAIAVAVTPTTLSVGQGASGTVNVAVTRTNFTGDVSFAVTGAPAGVTATFAPATTTTNASTLTLNVEGSVPTGDIALTVSATGTGVTDATTPLTLTVTAPPPFGVTTIAPDPVSVAAGASGDVTVTLSRNNFTAGIDLSLEGAPTGVTGTFNPATATGTTSTLTIAVGAGVAAGNYTLTVKAQSTGQPEASKSFTLTVPAPQADYTLALAPAGPYAVVQDATSPVNVTVNITRSNFTGQINFAVTGAPTGFTATVTPPNTTGNSVTVALSATNAVPVGAVSLTLTGTATGIADKTATIAVNVTAPAGSGNVSLDYSACPAAQKPLWVGFQDGSSPWVAVTPTNDVYVLNSTQSKAGLAVTTSSSGSNTGTLVTYYTQAEILALNGIHYCQTVNPPTTKSLSAHVINIPGAAQSVNLGLGGGFGNATQASPTATINGVQDGTHDLVAWAHDFFGATADVGLIRRDINVTAIANNGSIGADVDMTGSESFAPANATITVPNVGAAEQLLHTMSYQVDASCTQAPLYTTLPAAGGSITVHGVPAAKQRASDSHAISITAVDLGGGSTPVTFRSLLQSFAAIADMSLSLPSLIPATTPGVSGSHYKQLEFQFTLPSDLVGGVVTTYSAGTTSITMMATSNFLSGAAVDLAMPDFDGLAGWNNAWAPAVSATVNWDITAGSAIFATGVRAMGIPTMKSITRAVSAIRACSIGSFVTSSRLGTI